MTYISFSVYISAVAVALDDCISSFHLFTTLFHTHLSSCLNMTVNHLSQIQRSTPLHSHKSLRPLLQQNLRMLRFCYKHFKIYPHPLHFTATPSRLMSSEKVTSNMQKSFRSGESQLYMIFTLTINWMAISNGDPPLTLLITGICLSKLLSYRVESQVYNASFVRLSSVTQTLRTSASAL